MIYFFMIIMPSLNCFIIADDSRTLQNFWCESEESEYFIILKEFHVKRDSILSLSK